MKYCYINNSCTHDIKLFAKENSKAIQINFDNPHFNTFDSYFFFFYIVLLHYIVMFNC